MDALTYVTIQTILTVIIVSIMSFGLAAFTYFMDFCFRKYNVFDFWLPWLSKTLTKYKFPLKYDHIMKAPIQDRTSLFIETVEDYGFYKMLGGCAICFNVWLGFLTMYFFVNFLNYYISLPFTPFFIVSIKVFLSLYYLVVSNFFLRKMMQVD